MNEKRIVFLDYLRIIAIFAIVVLHVSSHGFLSTDIKSFDWKALNVYDCSVRWGASVFVMISGALFLGREHTLKKLYTKNILRMALAFLFWSALYAVMYSFVFEKDFTARGFLSKVIYGQQHMWFLYMIVGLYIIVPLLNKIVENRKTAWYFVAVAFVFAYLIPEFRTLVGIKHPEISNTVSLIVKKFEMHMVLGFSGYFVLGYLLKDAALERKHRLIIYILGVLGLAFTICVTAYVSRLKGEAVETFFGSISVNNLFIATALFVFARTHFIKAPASERGIGALSFVSKCCFGIYLIHPMIIEAFSRYLGFTSTSFSPILAVPALSLAVFVVSLLISAALNSIPIVKKWIV